MTNEFKSFKLSIIYDKLQGFPRFLIESEHVLKEGIWPAEMYFQLKKFFNNVKSSINPNAVLVKTQ